MADPMTSAEDRANAGSTKFSPAVIERNRAALYRWFARLFFTPLGESEVLDLRGGRMRAVLESLALTPGGAAPVAEIRRVLDQGGVASVVASLGIAHTRLFDGAGAYQAAPPYRSVYTSESGLLCQEATAEMEQLLRQYRLNLDGKVCEPADHLSLQLEVMSQLALQAATEAEAVGVVGASLARQADFIDKQLLDWIPLFSERLAVVDELGFHAGLSALLVAVLDQDKSYLGEIVDF